MASLIQELRNTQRSNAALVAKLSEFEQLLSDAKVSIAASAQTTVNVGGTIEAKGDAVIAKASELIEKLKEATDESEVVGIVIEPGIPVDR